MELRARALRAGKVSPDELLAYVDELREYVERHPDEVRAWVEFTTVAVCYVRNPNLAKEITERALTVHPNDRKIQRLARQVAAWHEDMRDV